MFTVGRLAKRYGLSRSTLLYYDSIGLLRPSGRSPANYRAYTEADRERLGQICMYRRAGLPLADIGRILATGGRKGIRPVLEKHLDALSREIRTLRDQQHFIVKLLKSGRALAKIRVMDKEGWIRLLEAAGLGRAARERWHAEFERIAPNAHQDFLESLGIPPKEVKLIRTYSRQARKESTSHSEDKRRQR